MNEKIDGLSQQINDIAIKLDGYDKLFDFSQQTLVLSWTIFGVLIAVAGIGGYFAIKKWVNDRVDKEIVQFKDKFFELENSITRIKDEMNYKIDNNADVLIESRNELTHVKAQMGCSNDKMTQMSLKLDELENGLKNADKDIIDLTASSVEHELEHATQELGIE